ncbi:hypothetical protein VDGD_20301 [Verticillium dahliae]|nr:hypothetical protein VDGD_20301 [Verticillium dahliae]
MADVKPETQPEELPVDVEQQDTPADNQQAAEDDGHDEVGKSLQRS